VLLESKPLTAKRHRQWKHLKSEWRVAPNLDAKNHCEQDAFGIEGEVEMPLNASVI